MRVRLLAQGEDDRVTSFLDLAGGLREARLVDSIFSTITLPPSTCLMVSSQRIITPSSSASSTSNSCAGIRSRVRR